MTNVPNTMAEALALASEKEEEVSKINISSGEDVVFLDCVSAYSGEDAPIEEEA